MRGVWYWISACCCVVCDTGSVLCDMESVAEVWCMIQDRWLVVWYRISDLYNTGSVTVGVWYRINVVWCVIQDQWLKCGACYRISDCWCVVHDTGLVTCVVCDTRSVTVGVWYRISDGGCVIQDQWLVSNCATGSVTVVVWCVIQGQCDFGFSGMDGLRAALGGGSAHYSGDLCVARKMVQWWKKQFCHPLHLWNDWLRCDSSALG